MAARYVQHSIQAQKAALPSRIRTPSESTDTSHSVGPISGSLGATPAPIASFYTDSPLENDSYGFASNSGRRSQSLQSSPSDDVVDGLGSITRRLTATKSQTPQDDSNKSKKSRPYSYPTQGNDTTMELSLSPATNCNEPLHLVELDCPASAAQTPSYFGQRATSWIYTKRGSKDTTPSPLGHPMHSSATSTDFTRIRSDSLSDLLQVLRAEYELTDNANERKSSTGGERHVSTLKRIKNGFEATERMCSDIRNMLPQITIQLGSAAGAIAEMASCVSTLTVSEALQAEVGAIQAANIPETLASIQEGSAAFQNLVNDENLTETLSEVRLTVVSFRHLVELCHIYFGVFTLLIASSVIAYFSHSIRSFTSSQDTMFSEFLGLMFGMTEAGAAICMLGVTIIVIYRLMLFVLDMLHN